MLKIERILCPIDFSETSTRAFDYAYSLALHYGAELLLEHAVSPVSQGYAYYAFPSDIYEDEMKEAKKRLQAMAGSDARKPVPTRVIVHLGTAPQSILSFAEEQHADLIVMGTHGRRALSRLVMGSVTAHVLRRAVCPVLAVHEPAHNFVDPAKSSDPVSLRKILLSTDFSPCARTALNYALSLAQEYNAELTLLHVIEAPPKDRVRSEIEEVRQKLEALIPADARNWCTVKPEVRTGNRPYREIIQFAEQERIDLAVLGVRGRNAVDLAVFGSTTERVLQFGPCPVLTVRDDSPKKPD